MSGYTGKVGIVQRVLPRYRAAFFDLLAEKCQGGLSVFAGFPRLREHIPSVEELDIAKWTRAENQHIFSGPFYLCRQRGLIEWLDAWRPDVLIVEANPRYVSTPTAIRFMKGRRRPVIGWGLGSQSPKGLLASMRVKWRQRFLSQFDAMIAYSQRGAGEYKEFGFAADRVFVAPNAVVRKPNYGYSERKTVPGEPITVLFVGRLQKRKRVEVLIKTCAKLPNGHQPQLKIAGNGPAAAELRQLAQQIYPHTEFLGERYGAELDKCFNEADIFVLPGTGGLAIQQAMSHGLPIIAAEGDGSQEDLVGPENGWLIPPNNDRALYNALADASKNSKQLPRMGEKSFRLVKERFNLENMVKAFVNAINKVAP